MTTHSPKVVAQAVARLDQLAHDDAYIVRTAILELAAENDKTTAERDAAQAATVRVLGDTIRAQAQRDAALSDLARLRAGIADLAAGWAPWVTPQCAEALRRLLEPDTAPTKETSDANP